MASPVVQTSNKGTEMNKKYQIFVSSTYDDLKDQRDQVIKAILEMGHIPVGMEMFSAGDEEQWKVIKRAIDESDYYIVIAAHRYGSELNGVSFTEMEYDYAVSRQIPVIGLVLEDAVSWPSNFVDREPSKVEKLVSFKEKIKKKMVKHWKNTEDLYGKCSISLMKSFNLLPRVGWIKGDTVTSEEANQEIIKLRKHVDSLTQQINEYEQQAGIKSRSYAQGREEVKLKGHFDVTDPNRENWRRRIKLKDIETTITMRWQDVIAFVLPAMTSLPSEQQFRNFLGRLFRDNLPSALLDEHQPCSVEHVRMSEESYNAVKIQILALGYAELIDDEKSDRRKAIWSLTKSGLREMYQTHAQPAD
ncbi:DUF4062 domain-containing protein [Geobacter sp. 60473]|uniref:DUF4062 domain-containing protein n=1 Tax=Geobacter sp. 60473 TaxID=3080755 RepID=UPI0030C743DF